MLSEENWLDKGRSLFLQKMLEDEIVEKTR